MAERRMFAKTIIDSDAFIDMPVTARLLYYDLAMRADDDGFVNSPKKIMRMIGASQDDLAILIMRKFIIPFDNGVVVIKHWRIHNYIRKDTYNETPYLDEKAMLVLDENNAYKLKEEMPVTLPLTDSPRPVDEPSTQVRLGKDRINKDILSDKSDPLNEQIDQVLIYLNRKTGKNFKLNTQTYRSVIKARMKEGFTVEDFCRVVDIKTAEWGKDKKMSEYLRPQTLFGTKMDSYLQSAPKPVNRDYGEDGVVEW